ncbi:MAG: right-handed parallel beta-helix repeat-containing protein, partial [Rhodospirillales bacterium]|nr:right-handed parallel beta-helix repeat-containing protein [Rhodospirillales bacterium]
DGGLTAYAYGTQAFGTVTSGIGITTPTALSGAATINDAVAGTTAGGTVHVLAGTYTEDVAIGTQGLSLLGAGAGLTTLRGAIGGDSATVHVLASNVTVAGFTITRDGNNATDWNNANLNGAGIAIQGQAITGTVVRDNVLTGNRTAVDINNSNGHTVRNNVITDNRTGMVLRNRTDSLVVTQNAITNNWTLGIVFLDASGGTNSPVQSAADCTFTDNNISGNWYGQIVDRQTGGALPAPGANLKNFSGNWFGTTAPAITSADSAEPGYAALIPVAFGGAATRPATSPPDIAGAASANFDITPMLGSGTDTDAGTFGFQGDFSDLVVTKRLAQTGPVERLQEGVNRADVGGTVHVAAGTYTENVNIAKKLSLLSVDGREHTTVEGVSDGTALGAVQLAPGTNGVTIGAIDHGFKIIGIDNGNPAIENAAVYLQGDHADVHVVGNEVVANGEHGLATEYGAVTSALVIDNNIFSGQTFLGPTPGGLGFMGPAYGETDQFSTPNTPRQLVVIGNGKGDRASAKATDVTFTNNQITGTAGGLNGSGQEQGNSLVTIDAADSLIAGNTFAGTTTRYGAALRVRRPGTEISGNTFSSDGMGLGTEHLYLVNNTTPIQDVVTANTFDRGAYVDDTGDLSVSLTGGVGRAAAGSTLHVLAGTYDENVTVAKPLTLAGAGPAATVIAPAAGDALTLAASGSSTNRLVVRDLGLTATDGSGLVILPGGGSSTTIENVVSSGNAQDGIQVANTVLNLSFGDPVGLSDTRADGKWYIDRYAPAGFATTSTAFPGRSVLQESIGAADGANARPSSFTASFYNTQGRSYDLPGGYHLLIGRDVQVRAQLRRLLTDALLWALVILLALASIGAMVVRSLFRRAIANVSVTAAAIAAGDLGQRVRLSGRGDEFDQLAEVINDMLDRIGRLMDGVRQVSNAIAHDLRTPITRARTRLEDAALHAETAADLQAAIERATQDLDGIVAVFQALLRIAEIEAGSRRAAFTRVDLAPLLADLAELYGAVAEEKDVALEIDLPGALPTFGDATLIQQAVANLLDNAVKFSPPAGTVRLSAVPAPTGPTIRVADQG